MAVSTRRRPSRSPTVPSIGDSSVPPYIRAPKIVSCTTEPDSTSTYQPRINVSISSAHAVHRSAGHWYRKLRVPKGPCASFAPSSAQAAHLATSARTEPGRARSCGPLVASRSELSQGRNIRPVHATIVGRTSHMRVEAVNLRAPASILKGAQSPDSCQALRPFSAVALSELGKGRFEVMDRLHGLRLPRLVREAGHGEAVLHRLQFVSMQTCRDCSRHSSPSAVSCTSTRRWSPRLALRCTNPASSHREINATTP